MIIDFHTHIFPDAIAERTIEHLVNIGKIPAFTDGTLSGIRRSMAEAGIDLSVVLPVATKPSQFDTINKFAAQINGTDGIISFGGIHPDNNDVEDKLDRIKSLGLKGIKLHPDYQQCYIDDERYIRIIAHCVKIGLIVLIHSGVDAGYPDPVHCTPEGAVKMLTKVEQLCPDCEPKIVLAHMGANRMSDRVTEHLAGKNVYFDLAYVFCHESPDTMVNVIRAHGADRVLFATDSPWNSQKADVDMFHALALTDEEKEKILHLNAKKLLGI